MMIMLQLLELQLLVMIMALIIKMMIAQTTIMVITMRMVKVMRDSNETDNKLWNSNNNNHINIIGYKPSTGLDIALYSNMYQVWLLNILIWLIITLYIKSLPILRRVRVLACVSYTIRAMLLCECCYVVPIYFMCYREQELWYVARRYTHPTKCAWKQRLKKGLQRFIDLGDSCVD